MNKVIFFYFLLGSTVSYALPFNIAPKSGTQLPTIIYSNNETAYYTVTNNTQSQRNNNFVKYLPPNVSQVTSGGTYPDTCGPTFNLAAAGQSGDSCTLQLGISGAVNGNDPNPQHHLFICLPGGQSCAGTAFPLNVIHPNLLSIAVTPTTANINALATQQFTATGTYANGGTQNINLVSWDSCSAIASISPTGLATGVTSGASKITASLGAFTSNNATLNVTAYAYIANTDDNTIRYCPINNNHSFGTCADTGSGFTNPYAIAMNPSGTYVYVGALSGAQMVYCSVNSNGSLSSCSTLSGTPSSVTGMAFNAAGTYIYLTTANEIEYCQINNDGTLSNCTATGSSIPSTSGVTLNPAGTYAYVASNSNGNVYYCPVNNNGSLGNCTIFSSGLGSPVAIAFNFTGSFLYITTGGNTVTYCSLTSSGGVGTCNTISGFSQLNDLKGLMFNGAGSYAYLVNGSSANTVSYCSINYNGSFVTCNTTGNGLNNPFGIAVS